MERHLNGLRVCVCARNCNCGVRNRRKSAIFYSRTPRRIIISESTSRNFSALGVFQILSALDRYSRRTPQAIPSRCHSFRFPTKTRFHRFCFPTDTDFVLCQRPAINMIRKIMIVDTRFYSFCCRRAISVDIGVLRVGLGTGVGPPNVVRRSSEA